MRPIDSLALPTSQRRLHMQSERGMRTGSTTPPALGVLVVLAPIACYVNYRIGKVVGRMS
jgi:hypothetical protein